MPLTIRDLTSYRLKEALKDLLSLKQKALDGTVEKGWIGICGNVHVRTAVTVDYMQEGWKGYSGNPAYPIPGGAKAYAEAVVKGTAWDLSTEYAQKRMEFLQYCIDTLEKELAFRNTFFGRVINFFRIQV